MWEIPVDGTGWASSGFRPDEALSYRNLGEYIPAKPDGLSASQGYLLSKVLLIVNLKRSKLKILL